ncbi:MAG TPA: PQQ-binding-like beta-propeller repeat protein, partial [Phycisphaerales bacterium]|nr:PQQ-binding-like beta-propeller repeat protein [Phycisphaerales bacterium]
MALSVGLGGLLTLASLCGTAGCTSDEGASSSASTTRTTSGSRGASTIEARRRAFQVNHDDWGRLGYRLDWRGFAHVGARQRVTHLTPYDDIVIVHESGSVLSVLEADTGAVRNANELATPLTRFLGHVREGSRVVVSSESELFAVDVTTGNLLDRKPLAKVASTSPVLAEGLIINGTPAGEASAYMLGAPVRAWAFGMGDPIDTDPVIVGDAIGLVSRSGNVAFLDAASGSLLGRARIFAGCDATPASDGSTMFVASLDQSVYAFHARGGELAWRVR